MIPSRSRAEYEQRMHRVLAHIDAHLDQPLSLSDLAAVAHFSPFHFHRLFAAWMGENFGDYLRRRRVEIAAMRMAAQPRSPILDTALAVGFGSAEAFTRAFKVRFGCSPTVWRANEIAMRQAARDSKQSQANRKMSQVNRNLSQAAAPGATQHTVSTNPIPETRMNVKIIDRPPVVVAYLRHTGPYGEAISRFWQQVYFPWAQTHNLLAHARFGISHDDPGITAPEQCRYDAAAEVPADFVATGGAFKTTIPGGKYATLKFKGRPEKVVEAWNALLRDWLPSSGLQLDARPCFEYYPVDADCEPDSGAFSCELCIPVAPL